jgi:pimeloyl-ACP methyl ester carboxylesterase
MTCACATTEPLPPWFDAIHRLPIRSVDVDGHRIAYVDEGTGPPVILLHGFGGSMWQWEYQLGVLSATARVITPDILGAGLSDKPDIPYSPDDMLRFLTGFMDALHIDQAVLVGHSMGAGVAIGMALDHPQRVRRLVLISGLPPDIKRNLTSRTIQRALDTSAPAWFLSFANRLFGGLFTENILKEIVYDPALLTPAVLDRSNRNRQRPGLLAPVLSAGQHLPEWETRFAPRIGMLTSSTLMVWGEEDRVFPLAVGRELHERIGGSVFVTIPRAGHMPQWERPDLVNPRLLEFLQP